MLNKKEPGSVNNSLPDSLSVGYRLFNNRLPGEFVGDFAELFRSQLELFAVEIDVIFVLDGDQMDVRMGNFHAQDDHCDPRAIYFALDSCGDLFGEDHHPGQCLVVEIEQVIDLLFRDYECVSFGERIDVEECVVAVVFGDLVRGNLPCDDAGKNRCHGVCFLIRFLLFRLVSVAGRLFRCIVPCQQPFGVAYSEQEADAASDDYDHASGPCQFVSEAGRNDPCCDEGAFKSQQQAHAPQ